MKLSPAVRQARKQAQLARLARKEDEDYSVFYANQPFQKAKAKRNEQIRQARQDVRKAKEDLAVANVTGENLNEAEAALKAAEKRLDDVSPKGGRLTAELTNAGSAA